VGAWAGKKLVDGLAGIRQNLAMIRGYAPPIYRSRSALFEVRVSAPGHCRPNSVTTTTYQNSGQVWRAEL